MLKIFFLKLSILISVSSAFCQEQITATIISNTYLLELNSPYNSVTPEVKLKKGTQVIVIDWIDLHAKYIIEHQGKRGCLKSFEVIPSLELDQFKVANIKRKEKEKYAASVSQKYYQFIKDAVKNHSQGDFHKERYYYNLALETLPDSVQIRDLINNLDSFIVQKREKAYLKLVAKGDSLFNVKNYFLAEVTYKSAFEIYKRDDIAVKIGNARIEFNKVVEKNKMENEKQELAKQKLIDESKKKEREGLIKSKFNSTIANKIINHSIWIGMTSEMAILSIGNPSSINKTVNKFGTSEQWVYSFNKYKYLYFDNSILASWQE